MPFRNLAAILFLTLLPLLFCPAASFADEETKVREAALVLTEMNQMPEKSIPPQLMRQAYGIAIFPDVFKAGFIVGARYGVGVVLLRNEDGTWTNPVFFTIGGGSFGWQIGAQASDLILIFAGPRSLDTLASGKFTLGADASVAIGTVGRHAEAGTDLKLRAEIIAYSRTRGLFGGIAIEGAAMQVDYGANAAFYKNPGILPVDIFKNRNLPAPPAAEELKSLLVRYTNQ